MSFILNHLISGPWLHHAEMVRAHRLTLHRGSGKKTVTIYQYKVWFRCSILCRRDHKLGCRLPRKQEILKINYQERKINPANRIDAVTKSNVLRSQMPKWNWPLNVLLTVLWYCRCLWLLLQLINFKINFLAFLVLLTDLSMQDYQHISIINQLPFLFYFNKAILENKT